MIEKVETWMDLGGRIAEARKAMRLTQSELATALQLDRTAITKMEAGERKVDSLELVRIAEALKRSLDWFLAPIVPAAASRRASRDSLPEMGESPADVLLESLARDVELLQQLKALDVPQELASQRIDSVVSAERAASKFRSSLGIPGGPIWDLAPLMERAGMYGFSLDLESESLDGSYLRLKAGGVALVNGRAQSGRRRFTLVHEFGHHVFADDFSPEWLVGTEGDDRERLINAFAIHFLLPRDDIGSRWQSLGGTADPHLAAVVIGAEFGVSWSALLGHLRNLRLIDTATFERLGPLRPAKGDFLAAGVMRREELASPTVPPAFAQAVVRAYRKHKIGGSRAVELLRGTTSAAELPAVDEVPLESMRAELDLG